MRARDESLLLIVDVQDRLLPAMWEKDRLADRLIRLARGAAALGIPVLCTEQVPEKLGPTHAPLREALGVVEPVAKSHFSCLGEPRLRERMAAAGRRRIWLAGIEGHVCVYQTARDLLAAGYAVEAIADAISSRTPGDRAIGLERMRHLGAGWMTVEMALFEALEIAEGDAFRAIHRIVK